jgi:hypothetical protein
MSDKKDTKKSKAGFFTGFSTGTGLRLWLFFLFCFFFMGYPVPLCILLGFAGGVAGGWVVGWWKSTDGPIEVEITQERELEQMEEQPRVSGLRLAKQRRDSRARRRSPSTLIPFSNFLRR